ncbi:MAG: DUF2029 domain-containing protein [Anaerolineales bacterium]|nr:DUF2029 domain-containing protein [Anaerolineales bacterium]
MIQTRREWLVGFVGAALLFGVLVVAIHQLFTLEAAGANDFYPRYRGAVLFWREGIDPYSPEATEAIQRDMYGRLALPEEDQVLFVYPFYVTFMLLPLVWLPVAYSWIQAIWLTTLLLVMVTAVLLTVRLVDWPMPLWLLALTMVWTVLFYNNARTIILGQFAAFIFLWLVAALLALKGGHDGWAGFFLALTTIKPQMTFLVIAALFIWALAQRRWRFIGGFALTMAVLVGLSFLLLPSWLFSFVEQVTSYPGYTFTGSPLWVITGFYWPQLGQPVERVFIVLSLVYMVWEWRRFWRPSGGGETAVTDQFLATLGVTMIVTNLILVRTATTNYIIMIIPLFMLLRMMAVRWRWGNVAVAFFYAISIFGLWTLFLTTIQGDIEHPIMYLPWPFGLLLVLLWGQYKKWWDANTTAQ